MLKRIVFHRVEAWINTLPYEYRSPGYIRASLGLLRVIGLPTNFTNLIASKHKRTARHMGREAQYIGQHQVKYDGHATRRDELTTLEGLL